MLISNSDIIIHINLDGLGNVHPVDLNVRKTSSGNILEIFIVVVEELCRIYTNTYRPLDENRNGIRKIKRAQQKIKQAVKHQTLKLTYCVNDLSHSTTKLNCILGNNQHNLVLILLSFWSG